MNKEISWNPDLDYAGFLNLETSSVNIISSRIADDASGFVVSDQLTIITDDDSVVVDLELSFSEVAKIENATPVLPKMRRKETVRTVIEKGGSFVILMNDEQSELMLIRHSDQDLSKGWVAIHESKMWVQVDASDQLIGLHFKGLIHDANGEQESNWLDAIGA